MTNSPMFGATINYEMWEKYQSGMTVVEIAKEYNAEVEDVQKVINSFKHND